MSIILPEWMAYLVGIILVLRLAEIALGFTVFLLERKKAKLLNKG